MWDVVYWSHRYWRCHVIGRNNGMPVVPLWVVDWVYLIHVYKAPKGSMVVRENIYPTTSLIVCSPYTCIWVLMNENKTKLARKLSYKYFSNPFLKNPFFETSFLKIHFSKIQLDKFSRHCKKYVFFLKP